MRKNFKKNIVGIMLAFIAILMPINAFAASSENIYSGGRVAFPAYVTGYSNLNGYDHFDFSGTASVFYSDGWEGVYCMSPFMATPDLGTLGITSTGLSDTDNKKLGAGLDYIKQNYGGDFGKKAEKYFVWWFLSGKAAYKGSVAYTLNSMSLSDGSKSSLDKVWYEAEAYSNKNYTKYTAESYCTDVQPGNKQPLILINYREAVGYVKVKKTTASNKHLTDLCPEQYSNAGAEFLLTNRADGTQVNLTTNENGESEIKQTIAGTYGVTETKAPKGHKINRNIPDITIKPGETTEFTVADEPILDPLQWKVVTKTIEDGADKNLTVKGAEFTVKYYNTLKSIDGKEPTKNWTLLADEKGNVKWLDNYLAESSEPLLKNDRNINSGIIGIYSIEETKAPKGLARDKKIVYVKIEQLSSGSDDTKVTFSEKPTFENPIVVEDTGTAWNQVEKTQTVSITINKVDKETGENKAQGYGTLKGAIYEIFKWNKLTNEDEKVGEIVTDDKGYGILEGLKAGLYKVKETVASAGYVIDKAIKEIKAGIKELNTANFNYDVKSEEQPITVKVSKHSINELGERILVKGAVLEVKQAGKVIEEFKTEDADKVIKALPAGKYTLHEKVTPDGYFTAEDIEFTVQAIEKEQLVEMFDEPVPEIKTTAKFETGVKESLPEKKVTVVDTVEYKKLLKGKEYVAKGKLVNRDNPNEVIATAEKKFVPDKASGTVDVEFTFDASKLAGTTMVVFEDLYKNGKHLVSHSEITDKKQTVYVPKLKTTAKDKVDGRKDMLADEKETIVDTVKYTHLRVGQQYTVKGKLMNKATGKAITDEGKEVTAEKTFTPSKPDGEVNLEFTFNAKALAGETVVVFEDLYNGKVKVGTHADITDNEQSIYLPEVKTTATEKETGRKEVNPKAKIELTDKISYKNLIVGQTYLVKGELIDKETKNVITEAEGAFIAEKKDGEVSLDFTFDARKLKGQDVVVFEDIYVTDENGDEGKLVAQHKDINSEGQTVKVTNPNVKTTATIDGKKESDIKKEILTVKDVVRYKDLVVGKEYTVKGRLMSKTTGKPFLADGKEVTAEKKFIAKKKDGEVSLEFRFPSKTLKKETLVVFEKVYDGEDNIATHEDINDVDQTVKIERVGRIEMKFDGGHRINTGDMTNYIFYVGLLLTGILGLAIISIANKKSKSKIS